MSVCNEIHIQNRSSCIGQPQVNGECNTRTAEDLGTSNADRTAVDGWIYDWNEFSCVGMTS